MWTFHLSSKCRRWRSLHAPAHCSPRACALWLSTRRWSPLRSAPSGCPCLFWQSVRNSGGYLLNTTRHMQTRKTQRFRSGFGFSIFEYLGLGLGIMTRHKTPKKTWVLGFNLGSGTGPKPKKKSIWVRIQNLILYILALKSKKFLRTKNLRKFFLRSCKFFTNFRPKNFKHLLI